MSDKNFKNSKALFEQGQKHLVGAVNSPVRAFKSVGGTPLFIQSADGSTITDVDDNKYLDFVLSYGPMILGHRNRKVEKNIKKALRNGYSFGASAEGELKLAKIICAAFPGMDKIRFVNSGTEAVFSAIRLARAFTDKNKIIKFSGGYHGHADALLVAAGSGLATLSLPGSKGVPPEAVKNTLVAEFNQIESVKKHIKKHKDIAAIIIEPIPGNMGVVIPDKAFIEELNQLAKENGILIIADEVMTGFRSKFGGAQELIGLHADITCLGKVIGGGFPVGAYGARNEIMELVAPLGPVYQAGTLSGNPVAMAAGIATLKELKKQDPYSKFENVGKKLEQGLLEASIKYNVPIQVNRFGSMFNPFFSEQPVRDFSSALKSNTDHFRVFFWELVRQGLFIPPSQFESWFLCSSLSKSEVKKALRAIDLAVKKVAEQQ